MSKITIDHSVLEKALQALESMAKTLAEHEDQTTFNEDEAMKALREALAQPQQEPVAVYQVKQSIGESVWCDVSKAEFDASVYFGVTKRAVYTSPPARQPLTDSELDIALDQANKRIDAAVEWNFGRCPNEPWFDALVNERNRIEAQIKALTTIRG